MKLQAIFLCSQSMRHDRYLYQIFSKILHDGNIVSVKMLLRNPEYIEKIPPKTKPKELVESAQNAIFCHKSEVSTTEKQLGKEVNLCWRLTGLFSDLNAWWQGNQEITWISNLVCNAAGTGLLKRKKSNTMTFFCSRVECSRPTFLNLISYVAKCNKWHHLTEYRVGFCMLVGARNWDSHTFLPGNLFLTRILSVFESWEAFT